MRFEALLIDLGQVVVKLDNSFPLSRIEELTGLHPHETQQLLNASPDLARFERGEIDKEEFHARLSRLLHLDMDRKEFDHLWCRIFIYETEGDLISASLFRQLAGCYRTVAVSNTNPLHFGHLHREHPYLNQFDAFVLSHEVGALKPQPAIYERALECAGCAPGQALFIDDCRENVEAALLHGIEGVVFQTEQKLKEDLRRLGILE